MRGKIAIVVVLVAAAVAAALALAPDGGSDREARAKPPGSPMVRIVSPRNGARQRDHAVVVKVEVENFRLAPEHFGHEPLLGEGHIRFGLNRVPNCVDPVKLRRAVETPFGKGRLVGPSFDFPEYSGPNGRLAHQIGSKGSYSPATRPEIYYSNLPAGFYRLVVTLAQNDGTPTPAHAVTNFEILARDGRGAAPCKGGKVSSAKAAAAFD